MDHHISGHWAGDSGTSRSPAEHFPILAIAFRTKIPVKGCPSKTIYHRDLLKTDSSERAN
jgi:hypothetical protein